MERSGNDHRIIVIGLNFGSILTMVRDFGVAGYDVEVLRVFRKAPNSLNLLGKMTPEAESRYVTRHEICIMNGRSANIRDALLKMTDEDRTPGRKTMLIPVDDFLVSAIDDHYDELKEHFFIPNVRGMQGGIGKIMDKNLQKEMADEAGLKVLESSLIRIIDGEIDIPGDTPFPCFTKPSKSIMGSKLIMKKCLDRDELMRNLEPLKNEDGLEILCERYVDIKDEYSLLGASVMDEVIMPGIFRAGIHGHRERKGVAITGTVMDTGEWSDLIRKASAFVASIGYTGMFDLDLVEDTEGKIYFTEMNFRAGASVNAFSQCGANIPAAFANRVLRNKPMKETIITDGVGRTFVSEKALIEEYIRNDIDRSTMHEILDKADIFFIKDEKDAKPNDRFIRFYKVSGIYRIIYKLRDTILKR
ncbi:MAG: hypothetical protein IKS99_07205 [Firmicutes bacterium]|nr:hypothetical protein [Bacillota bacterium]